MYLFHFGYPAEKLKVIGITGTKGKTTTTYMVKSILEEVGIRVGLIGTIEAIIGDKSIPANNTTPESYTIQKYFAEMVEAGCECVVMEVSSQGLKLDRTAGIPFEIGIFTNLGEDHIGPNEHKDFDEYKYCKSLLFKQSKIGIGNVDDKWFKDIFKDATCEVETFGFSDKADIRATDAKHMTKKKNNRQHFRNRAVCYSLYTFHIQFFLVRVLSKTNVPKDAQSDGS